MSDSDSDSDEFFDAEDDDQVAIIAQETNSTDDVSSSSSATVVQPKQLYDQSYWLAKLEEKEKTVVDKLEEWPTPELKSRALGAIDLFFNSKFSEALQLFDVYREVCPYHAVGYALVKFLNALMTFNTEDMDEASECLSHSISLSQSYRSSKSFSKRLFGGGGEEGVSQAHYEATICAAEAILMMGLIQLCQESIASYIKGGLNFRKSYQLYVGAWTDVFVDLDVEDVDAQSDAKTEELPLQTTESDNDVLENADEPEHESLCFGLGLFNIVLSFVPPSLLRIVEALGFSGDRDFGIRLLTKSFEKGESRSAISAVVLMLQYVVITPFVRGGDLPKEYIEHARVVVGYLTKRYPQGALVLWLEARLERSQCNIDTAISGFQYAQSVQEEWVQLQHLCMYELGWLYTLNHDFDKAVDIYKKLGEESQWSKAFYRYMQASSLVHCGKLEEAREIYAMVPELVKRKFAGKMIPMEKFVLRRANQFLGLDKKKRRKNKKGSEDSMDAMIVCLPMFELLAMWNVFRQMPVEKRGVALEQVEKELENTATLFEDDPVSLNDRNSMLLLIKGYLMAANDDSADAYDTLKMVQDMQDDIVNERHTIPFSIYAIGMIQFEMGNYEEAESDFKDAKEFSNFDFENRLQMRTFNGLTRIEELEQEKAE